MEAEAWQVLQRYLSLLLGRWPNDKKEKSLALRMSMSLKLDGE